MVENNFKIQHPHLWRKIDILCHGIKEDHEGILSELYFSQNPYDTQRTGNAGLQVKIFEEKLALNAAVYKKFCINSPYRFRYNRLGELILYDERDGTDTEVFCPEEAPRWYTKRLSNSRMAGRFILLEGDSTAIMSISKGCTYFDKNVPCKFCAIGVEADDDVISAKEHRDSVMEALQYVVNEDCVENIHLTGGNSYSLDRGALNYIPYVREIQKLTTEKKIAVEIPPPELSVQRDVFEQLKKAGTDSITMNIELWNEVQREKVMPMKGKIPKEEYLSAYKTALKIFGNNKVTCGFIVGIEPIKDTLEGIDALCSMGVVTEVYPFKPNDNSQMEKHALTLTEDIIAVSIYANKRMKQCRINPSQCSGCVKCGACGLTQQLYEKKGENEDV